MKTNICLPLGLPEFMILKQKIQKDTIYLDVEPKGAPEYCIHCGFSPLKKHDQRIRKVRDLDLLDKTLYLLFISNAGVVITVMKCSLNHLHQYQRVNTKPIGFVRKRLICVLEQRLVTLAVN
ncbi:transposase family protein [Caldalkalibacillus mannanilyticus]|uniref:transposase family protein n=1 Tax=Caldalkalibacillus mannanilyticus TaxID=1418 RepID=UPI00046AB1EA|nr:transposase family protein [Caldalkalibacillus mannanilyticus]